MCSIPEQQDAIFQSVADGTQDDVDDDRPSAPVGSVPKAADEADDLPAKKRKTRRGKPKRRKPYNKLNWKLTRAMMINGKRGYKQRSLAPYNTNQFLMNDHDVNELDDKMRNNPPRTRDSSFSVDSGEDMYSSPDDEEEFLMKEFDTAYESQLTERLQSLSQPELVAECMQLERKVNERYERLRQEIHKLTIENDVLRQENVRLKARMRISQNNSSSKDSESDSSDSCDSSSSGSNTSVASPQPQQQVPNGNVQDLVEQQQQQNVVNNIVDYSQTNGHSSRSPSPPQRV